MGDDRARQGGVDGVVEKVRHRQLLVLAQELADAVIDDDRVVQGIAENGQQSGDAGEVEVDLRHRHEADRQNDVVDVGDHGADGELPVEPEPQIEQDAADCREDADGAERHQFLADARTDHLDALIGVARAERVADLLGGDLLRRVAAGLLRDANHHLAIGADLLQLHLAEAESLQRGAKRAHLGLATWRLDLQQRAALEVDAVVQPMREEEDERQDRQHGRDREAEAPKADEAESRVVRDDAEVTHGRNPKSGSSGDGPRDTTRTPAGASP